jgi:hypothetical protein
MAPSSANLFVVLSWNVVFECKDFEVPTVELELSVLWETREAISSFLISQVVKSAANSCEDHS